MPVYPQPIQELIDQFGKLPGIGPKSAQRIVFYLLRASSAEASALAEAIVRAKADVIYCGQCFNFSLDEICDLCKDERRDPRILCVVEEPTDVMIVEATGEYRGKYHVLGGSINPMEGTNPEDLHIKELFKRIKEGQVKEIIIATNPNLEGETTALYISKYLSGQADTQDVKITMPASGLPVGGDLEYSDPLTLGRALKFRQKVGEAVGGGDNSSGDGGNGENPAE